MKIKLKATRSDVSVESIGGYRFTLGKDIMLQEARIGNDPNSPESMYFTPRAEIYRVLQSLDNGVNNAIFTYYVTGSAILHTGSAYWGSGKTPTLNIGCMEFTAKEQAALRSWTGVKSRRKAAAKSTTKKRKAA